MRSAASPLPHLRAPRDRRPLLVGARAARVRGPARCGCRVEGGRGECCSVRLEASLPCSTSHTFGPVALASRRHGQQTSPSLRLPVLKTYPTQPRICVPRGAGNKASWASEQSQLDSSKRAAKPRARGGPTAHAPHVSPPTPGNESYSYKGRRCARCAGGCAGGCTGPSWRGGRRHRHRAGSAAPARAAPRARRRAAAGLVGLAAV